MVSTARIRPYVVSTRGYLRTGTAAYRGPAAIIKELVQNADDAAADRMEFEVTHDQLIVRNSSVFSPRDFDSISEIASGGKRNNADVTGTWGTGFTSVFQLTDRPEIRSSGLSVVLDPTNAACEERDDPSANDGTEFRFPWRLAATPLGDDIRVEPWTRTRIDDFVALLQRESAPNLLFLRHLREIVITDARDRRATFQTRVTKTRMEVSGGTAHRFMERFAIAAPSGAVHHVDWAVFGRSTGIDLMRMIDGEQTRIKNGYVQVAIPRDAEGFGRPGILYNMLPTPVETGFRFQINGDFFPTADRTSILTGNDPDGEWNRSLIKSIATLFGASLPTIRDLSGSPDAFYRILPISHSPACAFLAPIVDGVRGTARSGAYAKTFDTWSNPQLARTPVSSIVDLIAPAGSDLPQITPPGLLPEVRDYLGIPTYELLDLAIDIKDKNLARNGTRLENASPILNSRERIGKLLRAFEREIAGGQNARLRDAVEGLNLAFDDHGLLRRLGSDVKCPAIADAHIRALLPPGSISLVDADLQHTHRHFLARFLRTPTVKDVVEVWGTIGIDWSGQPIEQADREHPSWQTVRALWRQLATVTDTLTERDLRGAPILVDTDGIIHPAGSRPDSLISTTPDAQALLASAGARFLHPILAGDPTLHDVRRLAGVRHMTPSSLVAQLGDWCSTPTPLANAHPSVNTVDKIRAWLSYFATHRGELSTADLECLRQIPFILTVGGTLRAAGSDDSTLSLPPPQGGRFDRSLLDDDPKQDYLVDFQIVNEESLPFVRGGLQIQPLSDRRWLYHHVADRFSDLPEDKRLSLLLLFRNEATVESTEQAAFINRIATIPLIPCTDGEFRRPANTFHPLSNLDEVFPRGWAKPDESRLPGLQDPVERARWAKFFDLLHLQTRPSAAALLAEVQYLAASDPTNTTNRTQAMAIYTLLDAPWTNGYDKFADGLLPLIDLAWLPARNRPGWFKPANLVPATFHDLAGSQVAVIEPKGRTASRDFLDFLSMRIVASPAEILAHLAYLGRNNSPESPSNIYNYLDQPTIMQNATADFARMSSEPVIFNAKTRRWYRPDRTYLANVSAEFGDRRLSLPDNVPHRSLFLALGVKPDIKPIPDAIDLLTEIAAEQSGHGSAPPPLMTEDRNAVLRAHRLLIQGLTIVPEKRRGGELAPLGDIPCVVDKQNRLHLAADVTILDVPSAIEHFPEILFADALIDQELGIEHENLLTALGVVRLSDAVERSVVDARGAEHDPRWSARITRVAPALRRIALTDPDRRKVIDWQSIHVRRVARLTVRYGLRRNNQLVPGNTVAAPAFYSHQDSTLYLIDPNDLAPIVHELSTVIDRQFPSNVSGVLETVLQFARDNRYDQINAYLDRHGIRADTSVAIDTSVAAAELDAAVAVITDAPFNDVEPEPVNLPTPPSTARPSAPRLPKTASLWDAADSPPSIASNGHPSAPRSIPPAPIPQPSDEVTVTASLTVPPIEPAPVSEPDAPEPDTFPSLPVVSIEARPLPFVGNTTPITPRVANNYARLRERFPDEWAHRGQVQLTQPTDAEMSARAEVLAHEDFAHVDAPAQSDDTPAIEPTFTAFRGTGPDVREARFILSGIGLLEGFLPLNTNATRLFAREGATITVDTDDGRSFPLMLDRNRAIIYNQDDLPAWFADEEIPAGAKLTIERQSAGHYRLRANSCARREVDNLRLLTLENGIFEVISGVTRTVHWEIDDAVYRAEIRLEDQAALFAEAVDNLSARDILIDLLAGSDKPLAESWLRATVSEVRAFSAATVPWTLRGHPCFVPVAGGCWRLDRSRIFDQMDTGATDRVAASAPPRQPAAPPQVDKVLSISSSGTITPQSAWPPPADRLPEPDTLVPSTQTTGINGHHAGIDLGALTALGPDSPVDLLQEAIAAARPIVEAVLRLERILAERQRAHRLDHADIAAQPQRSPAEQIFDLLAPLVGTLGSDAAYDPSFGSLFTELLGEWGTDPATPALVEGLVALLDADAWDQEVRPAFDAAIDRFASDGNFVPAEQITFLDQRLSGRDRAADRNRLADRELAREYATAPGPFASMADEAEHLLEALILDPQLEMTRVRLSVLSRQTAEVAAEAAHVHLKSGDPTAAYGVIANARRTIAAWTADHNGTIRQPALDGAAERIIVVATAPAVSEMDFRNRFSATTTALITFNELLPPDRQHTPEFRSRQVIALSTLGTLLGQGKSHLEALMVDLHGAQLASSMVTQTNAHIPRKSDWYRRIAIHAESLGLWDIATAAMRKRRDVAPLEQSDKWSRQYRDSLRRYDLERAAVAERYALARSQLQTLAPTDRILRSVGEEFRSAMITADTWEQFIP